VLIYSAQGQTADDVIVRQARTMAGGDRVVVVSNDVELRERCRAAGCEVSAVENLLNQLPGVPRRLSQDNEVEVDTTLSTVKRGNPRRSSRRARRQREVRF
jgi:predicted RNA-binding protein with PIN domain